MEFMAVSLFVVLIVGGIVYLVSQLDAAPNFETYKQSGKIDNDGNITCCYCNSKRTFINNRNNICQCAACGKTLYRV